MYQERTYLKSCLLITTENLLISSAGNQLMNNEGVVRMHRGLTDGEPVWAINHDVIRDSTMTSVVVRDICQTLKVQVCNRYHYISVKQT